MREASSENQRRQCRRSACWASSGTPELFEPATVYCRRFSGDIDERAKAEFGKLMQTTARTVDTSFRFFGSEDCLDYVSLGLKGGAACSNFSFFMARQVGVLLHEPTPCNIKST